jgi:hypothetical protein
MNIWQILFCGYIFKRISSLRILRLHITAKNKGKLSISQLKWSNNIQFLDPCFLDHMGWIKQKKLFHAAVPLTKADLRFRILIAELTKGIAWAWPWANRGPSWQYTINGISPLHGHSVPVQLEYPCRQAPTNSGKLGPFFLNRPGGSRNCRSEWRSEGWRKFHQLHVIFDKNIVC